jgi:hypothetical protein
MRKLEYTEKMQDYGKLQVHTCLLKENHEKFYEGYNITTIRLD